MVRAASYYSNTERFRKRYEKLSPQEKEFIDELFEDIESDRMDLANEKREAKTQSISNRMISIFSTCLAMLLTLMFVLFLIRAISSFIPDFNSTKTPTTITQPLKKL